MAVSSVHLSLPTSALFKFPPASFPPVVPPPTSDFTYANPFQIPTGIYNHLLHVAYPLTAALLYSAVVTYFNQVNSERNHRPWAWTKTRAFFLAVLAHNVFLALYSGWTFMGMLQAIKHAWPGLQGDHGVTGAVDALCKIHGPRGLGNGVMFNTTTNIWTAPNAAINLTPRGIPDATDLGRIWNEGLGFYGWLFYLSKFYEVLDSAIILAKGKTTSRLQTFHHAGAILSIWAGIRYMSPPIWLFVFLNSGIHTLMYTYYTLYSLRVPVPGVVKQFLTTAQIAQFVIGATYAVAHLFISYSVPTSVPASVASTVASAISAAPSVATSIASSAATSVASAASSAGIGNILRKVALRAAGEEGLAENIPLYNEKPILSGSGHAILDKLRGVKEEIKYTTEDRTIPCIDTSGQAFAIWLNLLYLAPLTYLFVNFWIRSYTYRTSADTRHPTHRSLLEKVSRDAAKGIQRELDEKPTPLPEQSEEVAEKTRKVAERLVMELEKEAVNGEDGTEKDMPGTYDGPREKEGEKQEGEKPKQQKQKQEPVKKGDEGGDKAGKDNEQEPAHTNGDVTKPKQQNKPEGKNASARTNDDAASEPPAQSSTDKKKKTDEKMSGEKKKETKPDEKQKDQKKAANKPQKDDKKDGVDDAADKPHKDDNKDKDADIDTKANAVPGGKKNDKKNTTRPNGNASAKIPETDENQPTIAKPPSDDQPSDVQKLLLKKDNSSPDETASSSSDAQADQTNETAQDDENDDDERPRSSDIDRSMVMVDGEGDPTKDEPVDKELAY